MQFLHVSTTSKDAQTNCQMCNYVWRKRPASPRGSHGATPHTRLHGRGLHWPPGGLRQAPGHPRCFHRRSPHQLASIRLPFTDTRQCHLLPSTHHLYPLLCHHPWSACFHYRSEATYLRDPIKVPFRHHNHLTSNPPPLGYYNQRGHRMGYGRRNCR